MLNLSLNLLIPTTVIVMSVIVTILKLIIHLRKRFPITVNCWFCNCNTKVPYSNQNSFTCPSCEQYNGFEGDDYNREIPEQHSSRLNTSNSNYCQKTELRLSSNNGLCEACNRNQEMKVIQLANFRPRCEAAFDEEIEEYKQKLEDSYQLCQQCQRHLKKALNRVKTKLIGSKFSQLLTKGIDIVSGKKAMPKDRQLFSTFAMVVILVLSIVNLVNDTNINFDFVKSISNQKLTTIYIHIVALRLTFIDLFAKLLVELEMGNVADLNIDGIATTAVVFNLLVLLKQKQISAPVIASMLFWSLKMMLNEIPIELSYVLAVKGTIAATLVVISIVMLFKTKKTPQLTIDQNGSFHKIHTELSEDSETEFDASDSSTFDSRSLRSTVIYSPSSSSTHFNSCLRERTLLHPAKTLPVHNKPLHNSTFGRNDTRSVGTMDLLSNRSFSIRDEVSTAERNQVHKGINKLNISGSLLGSTSTLKDFSVSKNMNPFSLENSRCGSPTPTIASVFSGSNRTQIISPPRLDSTFMPETHTSWVAGGYWSSPQKPYLEVHHVKPYAELSRSSSQSSGLGTIDSDKNSRENSIGHDDAPSIFSEPVRRRNLFDKPADTRSLFGQSFVQAPKVNNFFLNSNASNFRKYREGNSTFFK